MASASPGDDDTLVPLGVANSRPRLGIATERGAQRNGGVAQVTWGPMGAGGGHRGALEPKESSAPVSSHRGLTASSSHIACSTKLHKFDTLTFLNLYIW